MRSSFEGLTKNIIIDFIIYAPGLRVVGSPSSPWYPPLVWAGSEERGTNFHFVLYHNTTGPQGGADEDGTITWGGGGGGEPTTLAHIYTPLISTNLY